MDRRPLFYDDLTPRVVNNVASELDGAASLDTTPAPERRWLSEMARLEHSRLTYVVEAVRHPINVVFLCSAVVASLISGSVGLAAAALALEAGALGVVSGRDFFRRRANTRLAEDELFQAQRKRDQLLLQMDEQHRRDLERLELLVHRIRNSWFAREPARATLHESLGLDRLLAGYVRLAIAHRTGREAVAMTDRRALGDEIDRLERETGADRGGARLRQLRERRLEIARRRARRWDRNHDNLEVLDQQLETISDLIHMMHEQSMTPLDVRAINDEIDAFIAGLDENEGTLRELAAELDEPDDPPGLAPRTSDGRRAPLSAVDEAA